MVNERAAATVKRNTVKPATSIVVSPALAGAILAGIVLLVVILAVIHFRSPAPASASAGQQPVPLELQQKNQQFVSTIESLPPAQRAGYISHNPIAFEYFITSGTAQEKSDLAKSVGRQ